MHTEFIIVHAQITILCKFHWARACVASVLRAIAVGNLHAWSGKVLYRYYCFCLLVRFCCAGWSARRFRGDV